MSVAQEPATGPESSSSQPARNGRLLLVAAVIALVLVGDLWSKQWAWDTLRDGRAIEVVEHVFYFKFGFNTGSAFSFLRDVGWARTFFIAISGVALLYMGWLTLNMPTRKGYGFLAVGLIAGGAAGNLHDRFVRTMLMPLDGAMVERYGVIDFLQFFYDWDGQRYWPIFNVADTALVCGVFLFLLYIREQSKEEAAEALRNAKIIVEAEPSKTAVTQR